jgi:uncharacterized glyoxalase superfamily protein PhnB
VFQALRMVSYRVSNLETAKQWYRALLEREPTIDTPIVVTFAVGDSVLMLSPFGDADKPEDSSVVYWHVADIEGAYRRLLEAGATARSQVVLLMANTKVAKVIDPFGNVLGITSTCDKPEGPCAARQCHGT